MTIMQLVLARQGTAMRSLHGNVTGIIIYY